MLIQLFFTNNLPKIIEHSISLEDNYIVEYMTFSKGIPTPIAKFPIIIDGNKISVYHPNNKSEIISEFNILENKQLSHDSNNSFKYVSNSFKNEYPNQNTRDSLNKSPCPGIGACITLCKATHRALGVPYWLDSICCFWWPDCSFQL